MRKIIGILSIATLMSVVSASAADDSTSKSKPIKEAVVKAKMDCSADIKEYCDDVSAGGGRIAACLKANENQLSDSCRAARMNLASVVSETMDKLNVNFRKNCASDTQKFCAETPEGGGRILKCLNENQSKLSKSCKKFQAKLTNKINESLG